MRVTAEQIRTHHEDAIDARSRIEADLVNALYESDDDTDLIRELEKMAPARALVRWWWEVVQEMDELGHSPECALTTVRAEALRHLTQSPVRWKTSPLAQGFADGDLIGTRDFYRATARPQHTAGHGVPVARTSHHDVIALVGRCPANVHPSAVPLQV